MDRTRLLTVGGTIMCAVGIGFFMQFSAQGPTDPAAEIEPVARSDFKPLSEPAFPIGSDISQVLELVPDGSEENAREGAGTDVASLAEDLLPLSPKTPEAPKVTCAVEASAAVEAGAMVRLDVTAPCLPNERAVVHHNGMMFTVVTNDEGLTTTFVPALSENAVLIVEFSNGDGAVATTQVPSVNFYDRVVLQWVGAAGFELHAREYGAEYGGEGHVWSGAAGEATAATLGQGGFLVRLGEGGTLAPRMAEVYSFPTSTASRSGNVALSVETEVTLANCGQDIEAQSLEVQSDGTLRTKYLTLAVPDCSSVGDFLVLNNLVDDLKIAAN